MPDKTRIVGNLVSDDNLFVNPTTDNTGIGTTNPTSKLHVVGDARITGVVTATTFVGNLTGTSTTATNVIGGIGSITSLSVSGITTLGVVTSGNIYSSGIVTATTFVGNLTGTATTATNVVSGVASVSNLQVTGISTFTNGPVFIGSGTSTGTASQRLQVTGGAYVSGNLGIGTTLPTSNLHIIGTTLITGITTVLGNLNAPGNYYSKIALLTDQTISNGVDTLIGFSTISDSNGWYSGITTRTTPTVAGTYNVTGMVNWQAGSITNNQTNIQLRKNGTTFALSQVGIQTFSYTMNVSGIVTMNGTTDYIDFTTYTANPTSQTIRGTADGAWTKMEIFKMN